MPDSIFSLSARDRADFFQAAVARVGRNAILLEKDVWVVWALRALFEDPIGAHLVFKGGTSLSKAHRLIERFSEDVDLTYDIRELAADLLPRGEGGEVLDIPETRSQIRRVSEAIRNELLPAWVSGHGRTHHSGATCAGWRPGGGRDRWLQSQHTVRPAGPRAGQIRRAPGIWRSRHGRACRLPRHRL
jgi:hypothetical protein